MKIWHDRRRREAGVVEGEKPKSPNSENSRLQPVNDDKVIFHVIPFSFRRAFQPDEIHSQKRLCGMKSV